MGTGRDRARVLNRKAMEGIVDEARERAGSGRHDHGHTGLRLLNIDDWRTVVDVRKCFCLSAKPADTMMPASRFVKPKRRDEIEVDAVIGEGQ